jgi:hypothetical protein
MNNLTANIGHIVIAIFVIVAVTVLSWHGTITGGEAITIIAGIGGVSVGGAVASSSAGAQQPSSVAVSTSPGISSLTLNGATTTVAAQTTPVTPVSTEATP